MTLKDADELLTVVDRVALADFINKLLDDTMDKYITPHNVGKVIDWIAEQLVDELEEE